MKRYNIEIYHEIYGPYMTEVESKYGVYVRWDEVQEFLKNFRDSLNAVIDEE